MNLHMSLHTMLELNNGMANKIYVYKFKQNFLRFKIEYDY